MKNFSIVKNTIILSSALFIFSGMANAASFDNSTTAHQDITFKQPSSPLSLSITSLNPTAGQHNDKDKVANYTLTSTTAVRIGERFTPASGSSAGNANEMTFKGKNNASNKVKLVVLAPNGNQFQTFGGDQYYTSNTDVKDFSGTITISGAQNVPADTYTVSMDAVIFHP